MGNVLGGIDDSASERSDSKLESIFLFINFLNQTKLPFDILYQIFFEYADLSVALRIADERSVSVKDGDTVYFAPQFDRSNSLRLFIPKRFVTQIVSKDQGWSSYPSEQGKRSSNTWGTIRVSSVPEFSVEVYRNIHAGRKWEQICSCFDENSALVNILVSQLQRVLDYKLESFEVRLLLHARYPGWVNYVLSAEMSIGFVPDRDRLQALALKLISMRNKEP